jgi:hypothetical protein
MIATPDQRPWLYFAGKITKNGWRHGLVPHLGDEPFGSAIPCDGFIYSGPFVVSCDHGCYHGPGAHGASGAECREDAPYSRSVIPLLCRHWIERSTLIYAWIDCTSCYGTLVEIGWAQQMGKPVYIAFSKPWLAAEMWFVAGGHKTWCGVHDRPSDGLLKALELLEVRK